MKVQPNATWEQCCAVFRANVSEQTYNTWFKPISFLQYIAEKKTVVLGIPSRFISDYIEEHYIDLLRKTLVRYYGQGVVLGYRIVVDQEHNLKTGIIEDDAPEQLPQPDTKATNQAPSSLDAGRTVQIDSQLDPHRTFKNYIEGNSNKLSRSVGLSIAEHPNNFQFNPMFVFGPSGCGKTHLINAIGMRTKQLYPDKRVLYISARLFEVQFTNAMLQNKINDFIMFYQTIDMLIVDDVQEWEGKIKTQNHFFYIFDHLFRNGKRIILACDRPPAELNGMNERLITRFSCGLIAMLEKPNVQLCIDILQSKIRHEGLSISDDVVRYIAETANASIRDLQGVINSLLAHSIVYNNCNIDLALAERVIKRAVKTDDHPLTVDDILDSVCQHYNVTPQAVNGRSRKRNLVLARQVSIYFAQKYTKMPASRIGKLIGGRDHSTVLYSCNQVEQRMKVDKKFQSELTSIETSFKLKQS